MGEAAAAAEDDVLRRFVTLAPNAWTPESRADSPPQFRGEDIVDNLNADTYSRASKARNVAVKYADRMYVQRTKHTQTHQAEQRAVWQGGAIEKCGGIHSRGFVSGHLSWRHDRK